MNDALFPLEQKNTVFDKSDLLPVYMHKKGTQEDLCYFDKKLPSKDDNNNDEMKDNKIDEENKENIPNNKPLKILASNKNVQTSSIQEKEEYS